jgi:hypothetical protein
MATWTPINKNQATFVNFLRHATEPTLAELASFTFESVVFQDGTQLKDVTFDELTEQVWNLQSKNPATFTNQSRN